MRFSEYIQEAGRTAIYPNRGSNFTYAALGITDEAGELLDIAMQLQGPSSIAEFKDSILKEAGDVLWYCSQVVFELGLTEEIDNKINFDHCAKEAMKLQRACQRSTPFNLLWGGCTQVSILASRIAGIAKKAIRDSSGKVSDEKKAVVMGTVEGILVVLSCIVTATTDGDASLLDIAESNLAKLASRAERGVLSGSGDDR